MRKLSFLAALLPLLALLGTAAGQDKEDTPKAAATRKALKQKISVDFKEVRLEEALEDIRDQAKGVRFLVDSKGGVSRNQKVSYTGGKNKTVEEVLDGLLKKNALGYIVLSGGTYDGLILIKQGKERGYPIKK